MPIPIIGLAPLLQVFDMPTSLRFYRDLLGFELVTSSGPGDNFDWGLLRLNGVDVMLNTAYEADQRPDAPDPVRLAAHGDTTLYFGCPDLDRAHRQFREKGLMVKGPHVQPYGMRQLSLRDPDGYSLCFQWPASEQTAAQWREWYGMETASPSEGR